MAAYPVTGPLDVLGDGLGGALSDDLGKAVRAALAIPRADARAKAMAYSWSSCSALFLHHVRTAHGEAGMTW